MDQHEILNEVNTAKKNFGEKKCGKFTGAVTVEIIRQELLSRSIHVSQRDVYIRGLPIEVDLLISKKAVSPQYGILYEPDDVIAVIEVKNTGSFGDATINSVKHCFDRIKAVNPHIACFYLTLSERKGFKWAVTDENSGGKVFELFTHTGSGDKRVHRDNNKWHEFIELFQP